MHLKQTLRSLVRDPFNTIIMIVSLSIGLFCSELILSFLFYELGTDNFHKDQDRIYALNCDDPWSEDGIMYQCRAGSAEYMKENFSSVEDYCRVNNSNALKIVVNNEDYFDKQQILGATKNFFNFFSYELLTNNPGTALESKNNIVISTELAEKYFDSDAVGKIITLIYRDTSENMVVSGVFRKNPGNTQLIFDMVRQIGDVDSRCYLKLTEGSDKKEVEKIFSEERENIPIIHMGTPGAYYLMPLKLSYFDTSRGTVIDKSRDREDLWIAGIIGLLIVGIAVFNYLGILANKFHRKIREYYIRRINGSPISELVRRLLLESLIIMFLSFIIILFLIPDALILLNSLTSSRITGNFIFQPEQLMIPLSLFLILFLITIAFITYLVRSNTNLYSLKANYIHRFKGISFPFFNIFQITASIMLIICTLVIIRQIRFITKKPIGLDRSVIEVKIPSQHSMKAALFKEELLNYSQIDNISIVEASPMLEHYLLGLEYIQNGIKREYVPSGFSGDKNYLDVLGIKLLEGTGFEGYGSDQKICIVNKSFASLFPDKQLIGQGMPGLEENIITGIVEDFHYSGFKSQIEPAFVSLSNRGGHLLVKPGAGREQETREIIADVWKRIIPDYPVNTESIGERLLWFHRENVNFRKLIVSCSIISLFLSVIGLLAVIYQKVRARTKETGIRKINGATLTDILILINKGFLKWTAIAFLVATPLSWIAMQIWLQGFAYKTNLPWWIFLIAGGLTLLVSIITVNWQVFSVARKNPVESLRYE